MSRRFRVELFEGPRTPGAARHAPPPPPMSHHVDHILAELHHLRSQNVQAPQAPTPASQSLESVIAMWSGVDDIQKRLEITKTEIGALKEKGVGVEPGASRTTDELRAVVTGTEEATDTILAAAETIDDIAQRMAQSDDERAKSDGQMICDAVVQIFEACNFQDITGQRITKVVDSLQFIEERIASMIDVWQALNAATQASQPASQPAAPSAPAPDSDKALLNGPSLKTDPGVVSQDDVDALFR